jgi:ABC-2 type transport system permease protein
MYTIFKKEFNTFFASTMGYGIVGLFLLFNGLLLWYFKGNWNIFNTGFADLQAYFDSTPWLLIFLIPAITMRFFSDEYSMGTIEILKTRPLTSWQIVLGKYFAGLAVIFISLIPTILYAISINQLALPQKIDGGSMMGSYLGLFILAATFTSIGIFASILSKNQIIAFLIGFIINLFFYFGWEQMAILNDKLPNFFQKPGMFAHYKSLGRGVIDSRDLVYFLSLGFLFLWITKKIFAAKK